MYYSRSQAKRSDMSIPSNYRGNAFSPQGEDTKADDFSPQSEGIKANDFSPRGGKNGAEAPLSSGERRADPISSLLLGISLEDVLLLGLILVIHEEQPNDPILIFLLILLLSK